MTTSKKISDAEANREEEIDEAQACTEHNTAMSHPFSCMPPAFIDSIDVVTSKAKVSISIIVLVARII